jgi:predicted ester cyclase
MNDSPLNRALVVAVSAVCLATAGCSSERPSQLEANKSVVLRVHDELWSQGDLSALDELVASDFLGHAPLGPDWQGRQGLQTSIRAHRATFPDWNERVVEIVAEGDLVAVRFISTGTDRGGFLGNAPTDRQVKIREFAIYRLADGKIVEQWVLPDLLTLQRQLGLPDTTVQ